MTSKLAQWAVPIVLALFVLGIASESEARGRGGGGGFRGGGGGISRGGAARGGSIRGGRSGGDYRSYDRGRTRDSDRESWGSRERTRDVEPRDSIEREGSFETRRGETVDYSGTVTRTEDGLEREGSWSSTSGASGGGSGSVKVSDGEVQSSDRSRHAEGPRGETIQRDISSERHGDHVDRETRVQSSTGIDAETKGTITRTDDGMVARGAVVGERGVAAGTVARKGHETYIRGAASNGKYVSWGRAHCNGSRCYGGRVTARFNDYYRYPYYYYPYYYGWYSCPYGGATVWYSRYGTPIYGCSNVVVVHTTITLATGDSDGSVTTTTGNWLAPSTSDAPSGAASTATSGGNSAGTETGGGAGATAGAGNAWPAEANVSSKPVLMYEIDDDVVVYATEDPPLEVYSLKQGDRYWWVPGAAKESKDAEKWTAAAAAMEQPSANSTVITYVVGTSTVYLTNEPPAPGFYSETAFELYVWIPGVAEPDEEERALMARVIAAHEAGGKNALDREVRKLQEGREAPPEVAQMESASAD